jgi:hypothetical protein
MSRRNTMPSATKPVRQDGEPRESTEDRRDREVLERARHDYRSGKLETVPLEQVKRELAD